MYKKPSAADKIAYFDTSTTVVMVLSLLLQQLSKEPLLLTILGLNEQ
jgi:hypothetical protein